MKYRFILLFFAFIYGCSSVSAQSFAFSAKGGMNSTWLMNKNTKDDMVFSMAPTGGVNFIYYIVPQDFYSDFIYGLSVDVLFSGHKQKYAGALVYGDTITFNYKREVNMSYIDIPLLFRLAHDAGGTYIEIGPQFSMLQSATESFSNQVVDGWNYTDEDIKSNFKGASTSLVLGFGLDFPVNEQIFISSGVKVTHSLSDIMASGGSAVGYEPTKRTTGGLILAFTYRFNNYHSSKAKLNKR